MDKVKILEFFNFGKKLDLSDCQYGLFHDNKTILGTSPYYYFLAGLTACTSASKIIEIGTYRGGSTKSFAAGLLATGQRTGKIVTVDIKDYDPDFGRYSDLISKFIGDPLSIEAVEFCAQELNGDIDILFIDGAHDKTISLAQSLLYHRKFNPKFILWDDISLNESMRGLNSLLGNIYHNFTDISAFCPEIRRPSEGFGFWCRDA